MEEDCGRWTMGALLVLAGALLGASVALLAAPQSGEETREDIARRVRRTRRKLEGVAGDFADTVSDMVDAVEEKSEEILVQGKTLAKESRAAVIEAFEDGQKRLARQRERLSGLLG